MSFFIGIPTINRADLLNDALKKYVVDFPNIKILIRDNGNQNIYVGWGGISGISCYGGGGNLGVSGSWNFLLTEGFRMGYQRGIILNDDVYWGKKEIDIINFISRYSNCGFMTCKKEWASFIIDRETFEIVGGFDENFFPAYFEDNDYLYRMRLLGVKRIHSEELDPVIYRNSMSIQKDPYLNHGFEKNKKYYIQKWGGMPKQETFKTPFNK